MTVSRNALYKKYITQNKSMAQVGAELGCSPSTVKRSLDKLGIKTRPSSTSESFNISGQVFGELTVLKRIGSKSTSQVKKSLSSLYLCRCSCGNTAEVMRIRLVQGSKASCGCQFKTCWKGYGEISGTYWSHLKKQAAARNLSFSITIDHVWGLFLNQDGRCALSGEKLVFGKNQTASLDRIDSKIGYEIDNVQWLHKVINIMKSNLNQESFVRWCEKVGK